LRTRVLEPSRVENGRSSTRVQVVNDGTRLHFELPLEVHLTLDDRIDFYDGTYRSSSREPEPAIEGVITHEYYVSAIVYREDKELFNFDSRDMRILELIREKEDSSRERLENDSLLDRVSRRL